MKTAKGKVGTGAALVYAMLGALLGKGNVMPIPQQDQRWKKGRKKYKFKNPFHKPSPFTCKLIRDPRQPRPVRWTPWKLEHYKGRTA
jgi:hypothetical protein